MSKLNDTQLVLLSNAAKRDDGALTRSSKVKGDATEKAVAGLLSRKLVKSVPKAGSLPLWKKEPDGDPISLVITDKGLEAIGVGIGDPNQPLPVIVTKKIAKEKEPNVNATKKSGSKAKPSGARPTSKIAKVVEMLRKPAGATIKAIMDATDWQAHSVRGAIAGAIKKKMGLKVVSETRGDERVYRIGD